MRKDRKGGSERYRGVSREPTQPKGEPVGNPTRPGGEAARLEAEVYESQHTVGAGEREKEAKRAQGR